MNNSFVYDIDECKYYLPWYIPLKNFLESQREDTTHATKYNNFRVMYDVCSTKPSLQAARGYAFEELLHNWCLENEQGLEAMNDSLSYATVSRCHEISQLEKLYSLARGEQAEDCKLHVRFMKNMKGYDFALLKFSDKKCTYIQLWQATVSLGSKRGRPVDVMKRVHSEIKAHLGDSVKVDPFVLVPKTNKDPVPSDFRSGDFNVKVIKASSLPILLPGRNNATEFP